MYDTEERIRRVKERAGELRARREKRSLRMLSALCLLLSLALIQTFVRLTDSPRGGSVQKMLGATLMFEDAGAYVLVGVLSFTLAVVVTILCLRHRYKKERSGGSNPRQKDSHTLEEENEEL